MNKTILALSIVLLLVFGCIGGTPPVNPQINQTNQTYEKYVKYGDIVTVDYTLSYPNGTVIETTSESVAKENGIYSFGTSYSPATFQLSYNQLIEGFVDGVLGMKEGETKTFAVPPEKGYGVVDYTKMQYMPLNTTMSRFEIVPRSTVEAKNKTIQIDSVLRYDHGGLIVISAFDNETVTLEYMFDNNYTFRIYGYPLRVLNSTNETIFLALDAKVGDVFDIDNGGTMQTVRVDSLNETHALINWNAPFAGQTLYYTITLKAIKSQ